MTGTLDRAGNVARVQPPPARTGLISVRPAVPADRAALTQMFDRCTPQTRYRRFHAPVKAIPERYLTEALAGVPFHHALVACASLRTAPEGIPVGRLGAAPVGGPGRTPASGSGGGSGGRPVGGPGGGPVNDPSGAPAQSFAPATYRAGGVSQVVALASCRLFDEGAAELGVLIEDAWQRAGLGTRLLNGLVAHARQAGLRVLAAQLLTEQAWIIGLLRSYGTSSTGPARCGTLNVTVRLPAGPAAPDAPAAAPSSCP